MHYRLNFLLVVFWLSIVCAGSLKGQDVIPTQHYATPALINPALCTGGPLDTRVGVFMRQQWVSQDQWFGGSTAFSTMGAFVDFGLLKNQLPKAGGSSKGGINQSRLGLGLAFNNDYTVERTLSLSNIAATLAYQQALTARHSLSIGVQTALNQRKLDISGLIFEDMVGPDGYIPGTPTLETFDPIGVAYDISTGLAWEGSFLGKGRIPGTSKLRVRTGLGFHHLNAPLYTFLGENSRLSRRFTAHLSAKWDASSSIILLPNALHVRQQQGTASFTQYGLNIGTPLNGAVAYAGFSHRIGESASYQAGLDYKKVYFGFNVNQPMGGISGARPGPVTYEAFLLLFLSNRSKTQTDCPVF
jgi:type IX secretion system PorP/SprF family membrane protein